MIRTITMVSIALLVCFTFPCAARVYSSPEMTSSQAGGASLQQGTASSDAVGGGSISKSEASDVASTPRGLGWHLGGKPISAAAVMAPGRRRRRHVSVTNSDVVDAEHVPGSNLRNRRHVADENGRRQVLSVAAKRMRREWDDSVLSWIKRSDDDDENNRKISALPSSSEYDLHSESGVGNDREPAERINAVDLNGASAASSVGKRRWDDSDLAWLKRYAGSVNDGAREHGKRHWDDSVLTWIKRSGHRIPAEYGDGFKPLSGRQPQRVDIGDDGGRPFQTKLPDYEKRLWDDHEMAWLKK